MSDNTRCACCGNPLEGQKCGYCGFLNIASFDEAAERENAKDATNYRENLIRQISDISILGYQYGWKEEKNKFDLLKTTKMKLADGMQCYGDTYWSDQDFGQTISDDIKERELEFEYTFNGEKKTLKCNITPVKCDDFWHIGLKITDQLKLIVYLGREDKYAESKPMDLELR